MANNCSFQRLVGGQCGKDPRARGSKKNDNLTGIFLPVGSGHSTPQKEAGGSFYTPASDEEPSSEEISFESKQRRVPHPGTRRDHLNAYLCSRDISPVRSQLQIPWQDASDRTKCYYVRKAGQGLSALVQDIAPTDAGSLYKAVLMERTLNLVKEDNLTDIVDETLMNALAECYRAADDSWETRRQILSIMADKLTLNQLRRWIPDLSQHCPCFENFISGRSLQVIRDPKEPLFQVTCDHQHDDVCEQCAVLASTLTKTFVLTLYIDTEEIRVKRKQPYVEKIDAYCQTCICKVTK
ncbi:hypothetical protein P5673_023615 [Acropora cervicornis]|uniref:Uncharacterized protein n=1 Tax=Acropora cervicornis TaxID=6130 RepID=A0AAD9UYQ8_ACRCE|nr:hypothetical protein P5673_023615 [Acropora cervicornis]